jgi:hypothetical protein
MTPFRGPPAAGRETFGGRKILEKWGGAGIFPG